MQRQIGVPMAAAPKPDSPLDLLYIHPAGHLNELVVPTGVISALNSVSCRRLGRYAFEVDDAEIAAARIIALDLHWALALNGFGPLVAHIRTLAPTTPIIVGGISAGHWPGELLRRYPVDYVIQGDAEVAFAALVDALLAGEVPGPLANVHARDAAPPIPRRMSSAELSATDCVRTEWMPTLSRFGRHETEAFTPSATIAIARGCSSRCAFCYGSFAATFGPDVPIRSPAATVAMVAAAEKSGQPALRLIALKLPPRHLSALCSALAAAGPFHFAAGAGVYLCTPPTDGDLAALTEAFADMVFLSAIDPTEIVPGTERSRGALAKGWQRVAARVAASPRLVLDLWVTRPEHLAAAEERLAAPPSERIKVSYGGTWNITRPMDGRAPGDFDHVLQAVTPLWTFYAGLLLSPLLARVLAPWALLDELDADPDEMLPPTGPAGPFHDAAMGWWRQHRLAVVPGLRFAVVPALYAPAPKPEPRATARATPAGVDHMARSVRRRSVRGDAMVATAAELQWATRAGSAVLAGGWDHRGVTLRAEIPPLDDPQLDTNTLVLLPAPLSAARGLDRAWCEAVAADGALALRLPADLPSSEGLTLQVCLRAQEARVRLLTTTGALAAEAHVHINYLRDGLESTAVAPPAGFWRYP